MPHAPSSTAPPEAWLHQHGLKAHLEFQHTPLPSKDSYIRLLRLSDQPSSIRAENEPPRIVLETFSIANCPPYTALSYEWGDASILHPLVVGDSWLPIRSNLHDFFCYWYRMDQKLLRSDGYLWVDQICIDQTNTQERNAQVRIMEHIYRNAGQVLAWLGMTQGNLLNFLKTHGYLDPMEPVDPFARYEVEAMRAKEVERMDLMMSGEADFPRSYFTRLWTQQELCLANRIFLMQGATLVEESSDLDMGPASDLTAVINRIKWSTNREARLKSLELTIEQFVEKQCAEVRDKVFGLLGMVVPEQRVEVDYNLSVREVFYSAVAVMVDVRDAGLDLGRHITLDSSCKKLASEMLLYTWGEYGWDGNFSTELTMFYSKWRERAKAGQTQRPAQRKQCLGLILDELQCEAEEAAAAASGMDFSTARPRPPGPGIDWAARNYAPIVQSPPGKPVTSKTKRFKRWFAGRSEEM